MQFLKNPIKNIWRKKMKLKKTRKERKCYECKSLINKGDLYGQKSIALGEKVNGESQTAEGIYTVVHYMRIPVSMCQYCLENK